MGLKPELDKVTTLLQMEDDEVTATTAGWTDDDESEMEGDDEDAKERVRAADDNHAPRPPSGTIVWRTK